MYIVVFKEKFSSLTSVTPSNLSEDRLEITEPSEMSTVGKIIVVETTRSASPTRDSRLIVRASRKPEPAEFPGYSW